MASQILNRRDFLHVAGTAASVVTGLTTIGRAADSASRSPRVDAHLHCFAGTRDARFPYHERAVYRPEKPATPEHLLKCMHDAKVDYAIVVHPEPYQDDHRYLEHCLQVGKGKLKGTLLLFADQAGSSIDCRTCASGWMSCRCEFMPTRQTDCLPSESRN